MAGLDQIATYEAFGQRVRHLKRSLLRLLIGLVESGKSVAAYGAPAKGNTLLNYCGIGRDFIEYTVDRNVHKQGHLLPGTRIPVLAPEEIEKRRPDYVLILPWNLAGGDRGADQSTSGLEGAVHYSGARARDFGQSRQCKP